MWNTALVQVIREEDPPPFVEDFGQTRVTIYMGFVSFMILIWEHVITFADEVEFIWYGKKGIIVILFLINRYLTPLGFIINLFAYLSPTWTPERCERFVRYEGSMTVIGLNVAALMMLMRIIALYSGRPLVIWGVVVVFAVELGVNAWLLSNGIAVEHDERIHSCTMIFNDTVGSIAAASAWLPLLYDTIVLLLTLYKTLGPVRHKNAGKIARVLLRDGMLYWSVIFVVNLVLTLMIATAPPGLQNITAQLEYLLTVAMMSRITIHLRKQARSRELDAHLATYSYSTTTDPPAGRSRLRLGRTNPTAHTITDPHLTVTVEENTVMHDDDGQIVDPSHKPGAEWYEMRPPIPARLANRANQAPTHLRFHR